MGNLQSPENFNMKDLYLDVSLKTCIDGKEYDFTGRKTFNTTFYRNNIGFGITDINIDISTSLQPVIDITFKDLYGNTLFGTQRGKNDAIDASVLFNWPPPKFIFSFKGFLGRKVTWLLNLKTSNITYVPSDGSYEIKCSFVPNQWGFLADLPVLYLLACKKLRYESYNNQDYKKISDTCFFRTDSVFSYVRMGKRVDTKTTEETKDFELLLKQMGSIKYNLSAAILSTKEISLDTTINGYVNNVAIKNFKNIKIISPKDKTEEELIELYKDGTNIKKLDTYFQFNISRGTVDEPDAEPTAYATSKGPVSLESIDSKGIVGDADSTAEAKRVLLSIIDENIKAIDDEIKRRIYSSTKSQISKLTIGEVFRQIARDSGFILGSILQAGFEGYSDPKYKDLRDSNPEIIGQCFPLFINEDGEEVPAVRQTDSKKGKGPEEDYGVEMHEMAFVDKFIAAIGEGIAENLISDDIAAAGTDMIQYRINNLEAIRPNPYKPFYSNIAENILIRSGIIAYITRSSKAEKPGDFPKRAGVDDDSLESMQTMAENDMGNLTKDILSQLSFEDKASLKRFCNFFDRFISGTESEIGKYMMVPDNNGGLKEGPVFNDIAKPYGEKVPDEILNQEVSVGEKIGEGTKLTVAKLIQELVPLTKSAQTQVDNTTIQSTMFEGELVDSPAFYNASFIDPSSLTAKIVVNNGLYYTMPKPSPNTYYYILFDNPSDVVAIKGLQPVQDATSEEDMEGEGILDVEESNVVGFIPIYQWESKFSENEPSVAIKIINNRIENNWCVNYNYCKKLQTDISGTVDTDKYLQPNTKVVQKERKKEPEEIPAKNLEIAVYTHMPANDIATQEACKYVFGPFSKPSVSGNWVNSGDVRAQCQRTVIKTMCMSILKKLDEIETEKAETIANVLGKAGEAKNSLYKQMHTIFHQWQIIASSIANKKMCSKYDPKNGENLALLLEKEFGSCENHQERGDGKTSLKELGKKADGDVGNTLFVYDYPLSPVNGSRKSAFSKSVPINVKKSIINIQPLYKPDGNTTVLNVIQQICTKNNFVFVPFPGDANSDNINEIYKPRETYPGDEQIRNYFHVIFTPTPETRTKLKNDSSDFITDHMNNTDFQNSAISINFGGIDNQIIKSINVGTDSTKPTAESILNLQRLVDKENTDHKVQLDCSMLPVYEGRSYKATVDMLGNAQVYPMQYFYIQKMPMFGGLYQILKVSHDITPNNMSTKIEGVRMRFNTKGGYGGIPPITLDDLEALASMSSPRELSVTGTLGVEDMSYDDEPSASDSVDEVDIELPESAEGGFSKEVVEYIKKMFASYATKARHISFVTLQQDTFMREIGWGPGASWCSYFVKNIYKRVLKGEQLREAMNVVGGNVNGTFQNAKKKQSEGALKYFKVTKTPSPGSYVVWRNAKQTTPGVVHGHAGLVLAVDLNNKKMTTIEGNYGYGYQGSASGSHAIVIENRYSTEIGSERDNGFLVLQGFITPLTKGDVGGDKDEIIKNIKKINDRTTVAEAQVLLSSFNKLDNSGKCYVVKGLTKAERLYAAAKLEIFPGKIDEKNVIIMYLNGSITC